MKIKFDTATLSESEASGVIALLMELFPSIGASDEAKPSLWVSYTPQTGSEQASPIEKTLSEAVTAAIAETGDLVKQTSLVPSSLDVNGRPWDERIHASSKAKNADGTWRAKRGVASELVAEVEAELAGSPTDALDEPEVADEVDPAGRIEAVAPPPPPAPPPQAPAVTFPVVMKKITDNKILPAKVQELLAPFGLKSVGELLKPDRVADLAAFNAKIDEELAQ